MQIYDKKLNFTPPCYNFWRQPGLSSQKKAPKRPIFIPYPQQTR